MTTLSAHLNAIQAALDKGPTPGEWVAFNHNKTLELTDSVGRSIVHWTGFDAADMPHGKKVINLNYIAAANPAALTAILADYAAMKADAERYLAFFAAGLPITFMGEDYSDKPSLDKAIDAARAAHTGGQ